MPKTLFDVPQPTPFETIPLETKYYDYTRIRSGRGVALHEPDFFALNAAIEPSLRTVTIRPVSSLSLAQTDFQPNPESSELVLERVIELLLEQWDQVARHQSSMRQAAKHESFAALRQIGPRATSALLRRLRDDADPHWIWALGELTGEDPARGIDQLSLAADAWLHWGELRRFD